MIDVSKPRKTVDVDELKARIMRLSQGELVAHWTTAGIIKVIEEEAAREEMFGVGARTF